MEAEPQGDDRPVLAIAGATGFIGQTLVAALREEYRIVGLTRSPTRAAMNDRQGIEWRHCDLFSLAQVETALEGVDYAVYLVHSMLPNARLTQASFVDLDILLADNFARAAETNGVRQIVYLGGIRPQEGKLSRHLASRLEVEEVLASRSTPTTALRAGLVVGPGGSSMRVLVQLVRRLPVMVLPSWTSSQSAPIAGRDVVRAIRRCLGNPDAYDQHFEIGGPESMSYRQMMERTARALGVRRWMLTTPVFSPRLSARWVSTIARVPPELVGPLIESLEHSIIPEPNWLNDWLQRTDPKTFEQALEESVDEEGRPVDNPRATLVKSDRLKIRESRTVRSVQRLPLPEGVGAAWATDEYMRWLPQFMWPFLAVTVQNAVVEFRVRVTRTLLLQLTYNPKSSRKDRQLLMITGGVLARVRQELRGRLEFREVFRGKALIAAIHDFAPTLPWYLYNITQALAHLLVMKAFGWHLGRLAERQSLPAGKRSTPLLPRRQSKPPARETDDPSSEGGSRASAAQDAPPRSPGVGRASESSASNESRNG